MSEPYIQVWVTHNGTGPWICWGCREPVVSLGGPTDVSTGIVHHLDHDHYNNDPANLQAMHHGCHVSYHNGKRIISPESRKRMSEAQKKRRANESPEIRDKFIRSMTGKTHSAEARKKISEAHRGRVVSEETRKKIAEATRGNKNMVGKKRSEETKRKISEALRGRKHTPEAIQNITAANRRRFAKDKKEQ